MSNIIVLGGGCFWCIEAVYRELGLKNIEVGFAGGSYDNPSYEKVCTGTTGHTEVVKLEYTKGLEKILRIFFSVHDPTTLNRQGDDIGTQYRSVILYTDDSQLEIINKVINDFKDKWSIITTEVNKLGKFYAADMIHQDYFNKNPENRYCQLVINPKLEKLSVLLRDGFVGEL